MFSDALPAAWIRHAHRLNRSAEHLWKPIEQALASQPPSEADYVRADHLYAFMLVAGASLEAMFKAAAIHATIIESGTVVAIAPDAKLAKWLRTHDLIKIGVQAKMQFSDDEKVQLARFTRFVKWAGSYPTPLDLNEETWESFVANFRLSELDHQWFRKLFARAEDSYNKDLKSLYERRSSTEVKGGE